jgi:hypothetical protein
MHIRDFPRARHKGLVVQEMSGEVLVYDLENDKAHCLNSTSTIVWKACDGNKSINDIAGALSRAAKQPASEELVLLAVDQLNQRGLLESGFVSKLPITSRREVVKRIGLASMIALPVVASLVAPQTALASNSCTCSVPANCRSLASPPGCPMGPCLSGVCFAPGPAPIAGPGKTDSRR